MLKKRKIRIQKYISILKKKNKKNSIQNHVVLKHKLQQSEPAPKRQEQHAKQLRVEVQDHQKPCWNDSDDQKMEQEQINLGTRNKFRKFINFGLNPITNVQQYQKKLGKFYKAKFNKINWAQQAENIQQKDINDYLNEDIYFSDKKPSIKTIKFYAKSSQKHESIVSGLDWHKNVLFSTGLDNKVKVWHFDPNEVNPQLKFKQQKDIFVKDLPLSNCFFQDNSLHIGTLRKNLVVVDTQKWKPTFITSNFLKQHKSYQNFRMSKVQNQCCIFSGNRISILDKNKVYSGSILANQTVQDVCFGLSTNSIYAVTNQSVYEWDKRKMQVVRMQKKYLGFTSISVTQNSINIGSKLGTVYIYNIQNLKQQPIQNSNLVTHISQIRSNKSGQLSIAISKWKQNAIRVIDSLSAKSIGQWPGVNTKIGMAMQAAFNEMDYFGVGASHGHVSVYGFSHQII